MKNIYKVLLLITISIIWNGCDKGFEEINTNPIQPTKVDPAFMFTDVEVNSAGFRNAITYPATIVQQHQTPFLGVLAAGNVNQNNDSNAGATWSTYYGVVKSLVDIIEKTKSDPARKNLYNMARIWKAFCFQIITDCYGDVPYTEAGLGYLKNNFYPKYDTQESIYMDMLTELESAVKNLDPDSKTESADLFYGGNITKWKRLGNSILLRVAMRLSKVNPSKAQEYVAKAFNGEVFQSNADNCIMKFTTSISNPLYGFFTGSEQANYYLNETFVNFLKNTNDPRLPVISVVYSNPSLAWNDQAQVANDTPSAQIGMPCGYDDKTISSAPGYPGKAGSGWKYSQIKRNILIKQDASCILISYSQTQLLLAEARKLGWINSGTAENYYKAGIRANMEQLGVIDPKAIIPASDIDTYLSTATLIPGNELNQIGTQYWVSCFLNGYEAWANWRRTGFPVLQPNLYPTRDIKTDFIYRLTYPTSEANINSKSFTEAIKRQWGGDLTTDKLDYKVWWDVD